MVTTALTSTLLFTPPANVEPPANVAEPPFEVASAEVIGDEDGIQVIAYDEFGEVIGSIGFWQTDTETTVILADYGDGDSLVEASEADVSSTATLSPQEGWAPCLWAAGTTAAACAAARAILCVRGSAFVACTCLPELVDEFEGIKCPGF